MNLTAVVIELLTGIISYYYGKRESVSRATPFQIYRWDKYHSLFYIMAEKGKIFSKYNILNTAVPEAAAVGFDRLGVPKKSKLF